MSTSNSRLGACPRCRGCVIQKYDADPCCIVCGWQDYSRPLRILREIVLARPALPDFEHFMEEVLK